MDQPAEKSNAWVVRITGARVEGRVEQWQAPEYLAWYDPDGALQVGMVPEAQKAKRYPTESAAKADCARPCECVAPRADGSLVRPLIDRHEVEIVRLRDAVESNGG